MSTILISLGPVDPAAWGWRIIQISDDWSYLAQWRPPVAEVSEEVWVDVSAGPAPVLNKELTEVVRQGCGLLNRGRPLPPNLQPEFVSAMKGSP